VTVRHAATGASEHVSAGTVVWATGVALHPLAAALARALPPGAQRNARALVTDARLAVKGATPPGSIFAMGDAATVEQPQAARHVDELFAEFDADGSGALSASEVQLLLLRAAARYPGLREHARLMAARPPAPRAPADAAASSGVLGFLSGASLFGGGSGGSGGGAPGGGAGDVPVSEAVAALFAQYDTDHSGTLDRAELAAMLTGMDKLLRAYPATAQVAKQQGQ